MKKLIAFIGLAIFLLTSPAYSGTLVLSPRLKLTYQPGSSIGHTQRLLIFKYDDWYFSHTVVDPKGFYPTIDLTGIADDFIKAIFDEKQRARLEKWLAVLAEGQAQEFGIAKGEVNRTKIGEAQLLSVYDPKTQRAQVFIFDGAAIHHLQLHGAKGKYKQLLETIEAR